MTLFQLEVSPSSELPGNVFIPFLALLTPAIWVPVWGSYVVEADGQRLKSYLCYHSVILGQLLIPLCVKWGQNHQFHRVV